MFIRNAQGLRVLSFLIAFAVAFAAGQLAAQPAGYYNSAQGLTGSSLKNALHNIIDDHNPVYYDNTHGPMERGNEDPNNSNNVILFYSGRSVGKSARGGSDGGCNGSIGGWNREHAFPQGNFDYDEPMKSDLHALFPTDADLNQCRNNYPFDNVTVPASGWPQFGNFLQTQGDNVFEPRDAVKGDIARALFYMDVRYDGSGGEADLILSDSGYPTGPDSYQMGYLSTLLDWHVLDPVDSFEIMRHESYYGDQGNRNPFIDNPQWVCEIYGGAACNGSTPTPTPTPTPQPGFLFSAEFESSLSPMSNTGSYAWAQDTNGTPSSSTGPSSGANGSSGYAYVETSSGSAYNSGNTAILQTGAISGSGRVASFEYHMYGSNMGTLYLERSSNGSSWSTVWSESGDQGNSWQSAAVDLTNISGTMYLRFRYVAAGGYRGDVAIDDFFVSGGNTGGTSTPTPTPTATATPTPTPNPGVTTVNNGQTVSGNVTSGQWDNYRIFVPSGVSSLTFSMTGSGDADIYVRFGSQPTSGSWDYRPYAGGSSETVNVNNPQSGYWHFSANGYASSSNYSITASYNSSTPTATPTPTPTPTPTATATPTPAPGVTTVNNGQTVSGNVTSGQWDNYRIFVPSGVSSLSFAMTGSGDADIYVRYGSQPTSGSWDYRPYAGGSSENVTVNNPQSGYWHFSANGYASSSNYSITVSYSGGGSTPTPTPAPGGSVLSSADFESGLGWSNGGSEGFTRRSGSTPSSSTGPGSAAQGSYYAFMETSSGYAYSSGNDAHLTSPVVSGASSVTFRYHMYGSNIGSLRVQYSTNGGSSYTTSSFVVSGNQGNSWQSANVSLPNGTNRVRILAIAAGGWQGDIAIDDVKILD